MICVIYWLYIVFIFTARRNARLASAV